MGIGFREINPDFAKEKSLNVQEGIYVGEVYNRSAAMEAGIKEGDPISAGDVIGFMGDTGYSKREGTTGKFPVHLHLGIYIYKDGKEISVNPYAALKYVENRKIKAYSDR